MLAVVTAVILVVLRATARDTRRLSRFGDYFMPLFIALTFVSGFFVMHPAANPFSLDAMLLIHVLRAELLFVMIPLTKLSHCVLLPGTQFVSELAWHWPADSGSKVCIALGKENAPI